jgi:hypothetical protein
MNFHRMSPIHIRTGADFLPRSPRTSVSSSLPDALYVEAEARAKRLKNSMSEIYSRTRRALQPGDGL